MKMMTPQIVFGLIKVQVHCFEKLKAGMIIAMLPVPAPKQPSPKRPASPWLP